MRGCVWPMALIMALTNLLAGLWYCHDLWSAAQFRQRGCRPVMSRDVHWLVACHQVQRLIWLRSSLFRIVLYVLWWSLIMNCQLTTRRAFLASIPMPRVTKSFPLLLSTGMAMLRKIDVRKIYLHKHASTAYKLSTINHIPVQAFLCNHRAYK